MYIFRDICRSFSFLFPQYIEWEYIPSSWSGWWPVKATRLPRKEYCKLRVLAKAAHFLSRKVAVKMYGRCLGPLVYVSLFLYCFLGFVLFVSYASVVATAVGRKPFSQLTNKCPTYKYQSRPTCENSPTKGRHEICTKLKRVFYLIHQRRMEEAHGAELFSLLHRFKMMGDEGWGTASEEAQPSTRDPSSGRLCDMRWGG